MNEVNRYARRYHWLSEITSDFVNEPHAAVLSQTLGQTLNLVASESKPARTTISDIAKDQKPEVLLSDLKKLKTLTLPRRHQIEVADLQPDSIAAILLSTYERQPKNFEQLLGLQGVGPKTIRALSLIAALINGVPPSYRDPTRYTFAHGGKDGIPYPVDRPTLDRSIELLSKAINRAKLSLAEKKETFGRLSHLDISIEPRH